MRRRAALAAVVLVAALAVVPPAAAESRVGAGVVVGPDERVGDLTATGGTVVVAGTVDGDLQAYAGRVVIEESGTVTGNVNAYAGVVRVEGTVEGQVVAYGGRVVQSRTSTVTRSVGGVAGVMAVGGTVRGDVTAVAGTLRLAPTATVGNDVTYEGTLEDEGATVDGRTHRIRDLGIGPAPPSLPPAVLFVYGLLSNLLLGAILLYGFEEFSTDVVEAAALEPATSLATGVALALGAPLVALVLLLTLVGVPLALALLLALPALGWLGAVYGRFALGAWLLSHAEVETPWAGLAVGIVLVGLVGLVPYAGPVARALVLVLGVGALAVELRSRIGDGGGRTRGGRY